MGTLDAHLVALERKSGDLIWDTAVGDLNKANAITLAPLVVKNKVIVGVAGGDFSSRGYIDAYDASTGKRAWRFYTVPLPGEPGARGTVTRIRFSTCPIICASSGEPGL